MAQDNTVVLRVQLDEGKTEERLKALVLDIEKNRAAQLALTAARKAGTKTDEEYAAETVQLRTQLKGQQQEQTALTKNLELYRTATGELANSYVGQQAQLSLAQRQYHELEGSQNNSTEATKALSATIATLRGELKATDEVQGLFVRNIGQYPKGESLAPLVQQLVHLEEALKSGTLTTQQAAEADRAVIGFKSQIAQAGAKEGKSYEETTNFVKEYGTAIRPATQELLKLEQEQQRVTESGEEAGEAVQQIGFRMGAARKAIQDATAALKEVPPAAAEVGGGVAAALGQASEAAEVLGVDVGGLESGFARAKKGVDIAKSAFGSLRGAMLAVPVFALLAALTALVAYFTKTREGANQLETATAKIGAVFDVLVDRAGVLGKAISQLFSGEFTAAAETARQAYKGIGDEMQREITLAGELSRARQQLERDEINNIDTNKRLLNIVERLRNVRDNEFNTIKQRQAANEKAYAVEVERERTLVDLAQRKVDLLLQEINRRGGLAKASNDDLRAYKEAQNEVADLQEDAAGKQNELITNRYQLEQEGIDKSIERRGQAFALEAAMLSKRLAQVQVNSDEELSILQRQLRNEQQASLNVKNLTVAQKKAIDLKYETDSLKLSQDFAKQRILAAYEASLATVQAELIVIKQGTQAETELRIEAINIQLQAQLAALDKRSQNEEKVALLRASAEKAINDTKYAAAQQALEQYLQGEKNVLDERVATGKISEDAYNKAVLESDVMAAAARLQLAKNYGQQATQQEQALTQAKIAQLKSVQEAETATLKQRIEAGQAFGQQVGEMFADVLTNQGKSFQDFAASFLILLLDLLEKQTLATLGATIFKTTAESISTPQSALTGGAAGFAQAALLTAAITAAFEIGKAAIKSSLTTPEKQFALGTVLDGPSHAAGGVQLYGAGGYHYGEAEGGEAIITRRATSLFLPLLSTINQMGGGRALTPNLPRYNLAALGAITQPVAQAQLRGQVEEGIDYNRLALAMSKLNVKATISDVKAGLERDRQTRALANS